MQWFTTSRLSDHQELTPEGFLLVRDVPIARTGQQLYRDVELPDLIANGDGWIAVDREPDEVFRADSIASFPGKPITDDHPMDVVTPDNWSNLAIGVVQNPRRGSGEFHDLLLADLLFTTSHGIQQVRGGKRALSVGYDARYEQDAPGRARQRHIVANHVALVDEGRCGTRCVILDGAPAYNIDAPAHHHDDACGCDACADTAWTADIDFDWIESEHPRVPGGQAGGGEFTSGGGGGTSISSGFEGISGGSGGSGWKQSLPAPPSYVKSFGEKIKAAVAAHQGEPHELVAGIKAIAQAGSHNPNNISYANKVLKHLAAASGQTSGAVGTVKATTAPVGQPPPPPPTPAPLPATAPAQAASVTPGEIPPLKLHSSPTANNVYQLAKTGLPVAEKINSITSYVANKLAAGELAENSPAHAYVQQVLAALGGAKPVEVKGPDPHPDSPPQAEVHKLATDPNTTPVEKILALKDYPTVQSFPTGYTAKFANEWAEAIASAHNIGPLDLKQAEAKAKPAKAASKSKAAPATIANVHGAAAEPPSNIVMAPSTARAEHARFIESKAKQPSSTMDFEADTIAPSLKHEFWQTVDSETKDICTQYGGSFYHTMNGAMRDENAWSAATQKQIDKMDALFFRDEALTTEPVIVRRGENMGPEMKQAIAKWRVAVAKGQSCLYSRAGYTSSSMANQPAFASKELWWHFTVPKGFPMVGLAGHVGHVEREVLFNHGQQTEIYEIWEAGGKTHIKAILRH